MSLLIHTDSHAHIKLNYILTFLLINSNLHGIYISGEGNGNPLQCSCLDNPMDGGAWWAAVHGVAKSRTGLSDFTFTFHFHALEKEMATHSSVLAWRISGTGEPGGLPSMGSHRVRHDWSDLAAAAALIYQKKARQWLFSVVYRVHHTYWRAQCRFWRPNDSSNWVTNRLKSGQPLLPFLERCRRKPSAAVNYRVRTQLR